MAVKQGVTTTEALKVTTLSVWFPVAHGIYIVYPSEFYDSPSRMNVQFDMDTHALRRTASGRFSQTTDASVSQNSGLAAGKVNWNGK